MLQFRKAEHQFVVVEEVASVEEEEVKGEEIGQVMVLTQEDAIIVIELGILLQIVGFHSTRQVMQKKLRKT